MYRSTATVENVRRSWENLFTPLPPTASITQFNQKIKRKKTGNWRWRRRTTTSMSNTFRVFLDVAQRMLPKAYQRGGHNAKAGILESCLCVKPTGQSQSPHKWLNSISINISTSTSMWRCSELLFGSPLSLSLFHYQCLCHCLSAVCASGSFNSFSVVALQICFLRSRQQQQQHHSTVGQHFGQHFRHSQQANLHTYRELIPSTQGVYMVYSYCRMGSTRN